MRRLRPGRALAVPLALFAAACTSSKIQPCNRDSDCSTGDSCAPKGCVPCPVCGDGDRCVGGQCLPIACGELGCHTGQGCEGGECIDGLCIGVSCPSGQSCVNGGCLSRACAQTACPEGDVCFDGGCVVSICVGVACPPGQACADGTCLATTCGGATCPSGDVCSSGSCVESDCVGVLCAGGELCTGGLCLPTSCGATPCAAGQVCVLNQCVDAAPDAGAPDSGGFDAGQPVVCADGGPGCTVDGGAFACGALDPSNACRSCQPNVSGTVFTPFADGSPCDAGAICGYGDCVSACDVGGVLLPSGVLNPANACQACQPLASTSSFTSLADGTPCGSAELCIAGTCTSGCQIAGALYAPGALELSNACHVCRPSTLTSNWSDVMDGTSCAPGEVCSSGTCVGKCFIDGGLVGPGTTEPGNACASCEPALSATTWTPRADGTSCGGLGTCGGGACQCPSGMATCSFQCVDERTNSANCGSCGTVCPLDAGLPDGGLVQTACFGSACGLVQNLSQPLIGAAAATGPDGLIYLFGGSNGGYQYYNPAECMLVVANALLAPSVLAFNPVTNAWAPSPPPMPTVREFLGAATGADGRLYTVGGATRDPSTGDPVPSNAVEAYDTATKSWSSLPPLPTARFGLAVATGSDGRIYALGGCTTYVGFRGQAPQYYCSSIVAAVEAYDPSTNAWSTAAPLPSALWFLEAVTGSDGKLYALGGDNNCNAALAYDPTGNTWSTAPGTTNACFGVAVSGSDGRLYSFGGSPGTPYACGPSATLNGANLLTAFTPGASSWTQLAPLNTGRSWLAGAVGPDGRLYAFGGLLPASSTTWTPSPAVEVYDPALGAWSP